MLLKSCTRVSQWTKPAEGWTSRKSTTHKQWGRKSYAILINRSVWLRKSYLQRHSVGPASLSSINTHLHTNCTHTSYSLLSSKQSPINVFTFTNTSSTQASSCEVKTQNNVVLNKNQCLLSSFLDKRTEIWLLLLQFTQNMLPFSDPKYLTLVIH